MDNESRTEEWHSFAVRTKVSDSGIKIEIGFRRVKERNLMMDPQFIELEEDKVQWGLEKSRNGTGWEKCLG